MTLTSPRDHSRKLRRLSAELHVPVERRGRIRYYLFPLRCVISLPRAKLMPPGRAPCTQPADQARASVGRSSSIRRRRRRRGPAPLSPLSSLLLLALLQSYSTFWFYILFCISRWLLQKAAVIFSASRGQVRSAACGTGSRDHLCLLGGKARSSYM